LDEEWLSFLKTQTDNVRSVFLPMTTNTKLHKSESVPVLDEEIPVECDELSIPECELPECEDLYISTKTKVLFLNQEIDTKHLFWSIPVIDYWRPVDGVIKKQMKIVSNSQEEFDDLQTRLQQITNIYSEHVIKTVNTMGKRRTIFKDDRKITVGTSRKDIMNCRGKVKKAFMNCFALILRFKFEGMFREMHVKVFNTGKLEIPGILSNAILDKMKERIIATIQPHLAGPVDFVENAKADNVLINSNFNCGFCINKDRLYSILRSDKYGIEITNDPCHYPGLKCKYYYKQNLPMDHPDQNGQLYKEDRGQKLSELETSQRYVKASFMIFRTGSCLILGNCSEEVIQHIFVFLRRLLQEEYDQIVAPNEQPMNKTKKTKPRKKQLTMSGAYYGVLSSSRNFVPTSTI
jgi:hypothetical protein